MKRYLLFVSTILCMLLSAEAGAAGSMKSLWATGIAPAFAEIDASWADSLLETMSTEQKIAQLFVLRHTDLALSARNMQKFGAGGFIGSAEGLGSDIAALKKHGTVAPFFVSASIDDAEFRKRGIVHCQDLAYMSDHGSLSSIFKNIIDDQRKTGINILLGPYIATGNSHTLNGLPSQVLPAYQSAAKESGVICAAGVFPYEQAYPPVLSMADSILGLFTTQIESGIPAILLSPHFFAQIVTGNSEPDIFDMRMAVNNLRKKQSFHGLIISSIPDSLCGYNTALTVEALASGCNVVMNVADPEAAVHAVLQAIGNGRISMKNITSLCRQVLQAKYWLQIAATGYYPSTAYLDSPEGIRKTIARESITVLKNTDLSLPMKDLDVGKLAHVHIGKNSAASLAQMLSQYANCDSMAPLEELSISTISKLIAQMSRYRHIFISTDISLDARQSELLANVFEILHQQSEITLILLGADCDISHLSTEKLGSIVLSPHNSPMHQEELAQILFGALPAKGTLPHRFSGFPAGAGIHYPSCGRLRYTVPEEAGMSSLMLSQIDSVVRSAIAQKATPGCQVLAARGGAVVFEKSYGYHTYDSVTPVQNKHLYDIASITKVAATTVSLMRMEDEQLFSTDRRMQEFLPYLDATNKGNLLLSDILTHQAQLHPWIPFYLTLIEGYDDPSVRISSTRPSKEHSVRAGNNFYLKTGYRYRPGLLSAQPDSIFSIEVAKGLYINKWYADSIFCRIDQSPLKEAKKYLYSDLGFIYLRKIIEQQTQVPLERYTDSVFYAPLGAHTMGYLPLKRIADSIIVPTEEDIIFRRQLLRGYVHDPGAAMLGGVSGHAGLFSNANDLAKLSQMLLNGGEYGGRTYIERTTIEKYTGCPKCSEGNRRGYGWDRPAADKNLSSVCAQVSDKSYGHSGFTGTILWIDPAYDLIYIFLSNRVYPDSDNKMLGKLNVRPEIQKIIYNSIQTSCNVPESETK